MYRFSRFTVLTLAGVLLAGSLGAAEPPPITDGDAFQFLDPGPLRVRDQFLLGMGFLAFEPVGARVLDQGQWQLGLVLTVNNDFAHAGAVEAALGERGERVPLDLEYLRSIVPNDPNDGRFLVDSEHYRAALALRRGIGNHTQIEVMIQAISFRGGFLDATIEHFHDLFQLNQAGREAVPRDQFLVYVDASEFLLFTQDEPEWGLGDIVVGVKRDLRPQGKPRSLELAVEGKVKIPVGDSELFTSSESVDFGLQFIGTKYYRNWSAHGAMGALYLGSWDRLNLGRQLQLSGMLALERTLGPKSALVLQSTVSESPFGDLRLEDLQGVSTQFTLGYKRRIANQILFLGLTENASNFDVSPDIGIHLGITSKF